MDDRNVFNLIDRDDDGPIEAEEVRSGSEAWFLAYDGDGDGDRQDCRDEVAGATTGASGSDTSGLVLADLDADGDGTVPPAPWNVPAARPDPRGLFTPAPTPSPPQR